MRSKGEGGAGVRGLALRERTIQCGGSKQRDEAVGSMHAPDYKGSVVRVSVYDDHYVHTSRMYLGTELGYGWSPAFRGDESTV
jgi:hypothetical protein